MLTSKGVRPFSYEKVGKGHNGFQYDFDMGFPEM